MFHPDPITLTVVSVVSEVVVNVKEVEVEVALSVAVVTNVVSVEVV